MKHLLLSIAFAAIPGFALAATSVNDTFDSDLEGWIANTIQTSVVHNPALGNPAGSLETFNSNGSFGVIGASNLDADHTGTFDDGLWTVSFDVNYGFGDFASTLLRFRFQSPAFNGWHYAVDSAPAAGTGWHSYAVSFDTTWDDLTATANGWVQEPTSTSFASLFDDVWSAEVRINTSPTSGALIDNYKAVAPAAVPLPAGMALLASALGLLGARRVRRRR